MATTSEAEGRGFQPGPVMRQESGAHAVARRIREAIVRGELAPGDRLPGERELAESFGLSRLTLRAGLSQLQAAGLLAVKHGGRYVVQDYRATGGPELLAGIVELARTPKEVRAAVADLLSVRRALAIAVLERLVTTWSKAGSERVRQALARLEKLVEAGAPAADIAVADVATVAALVAETGSAVLRVCFNPVAAVLMRLPKLQEVMFREPERNLASYRMVLDALDAGEDDLPRRIGPMLHLIDDETADRMSRVTAREARREGR